MKEPTQAAAFYSSSSSHVAVQGNNPAAECFQTFSLPFPWVSPTAPFTFLGLSSTLPSDILTSYLNPGALR